MIISSSLGRRLSPFIVGLTREQGVERSWKPLVLQIPPPAPLSLVLSLTLFPSHPCAAARMHVCVGAANDWLCLLSEHCAVDHAAGFPMQPSTTARGTHGLSQRAVALVSVCSAVAVAL
ncbi:hypothetical protein SNOG_12741 [Parastagonospora nodorum SN15]|uniref:Uncharacterized protein n=1 Tax=Phaeosphaeria nodorum (strain SN15 / ATCC MYA-4574 / FGSC 10173) TaxID=321614 RepID=Q0U673_PHANO|nr:hypothetical protein SNOG_12741 [Parastagonospora nodorum SN15]EAT80039.1 hypothetical protein SNOG_12741 [Parastagonospora nodorum SN15]